MVLHFFSKRSKDPNTCVGACIVDENKGTVSDTMEADRMFDDIFLWEREGKY